MTNPDEPIGEQSMHRWQDLFEECLGDVLYLYGDTSATDGLGR
ncbi:MULTISPECIES: hypothetical protein [Mycobacteriaceae]|uniref:Uncharacterized protein n=1 Tax=Mycolicibacterium vanbaalenii TaxID=110539 RepID=A0A5S9RA64_MYCVN|nr:MULTISPECIES: hypothetical protein [Mycobacteriaceae]CAA0137339.1 Uncharacterised protein [Mycolicibacterium vanbaalenii]